MTITTILASASTLCLSSVIHHEAGGEGYEGKVAVASVVMNRVESPRFPNNVCAVVKQPKQFSWVGKKPMTMKQETLARKILNGEIKRVLPTALFFTNVRVWFKRAVVATIGRHRFYR